MKPSERLRSSGDYVEWLRLSVHEREIPATDRLRAAGACIAVVQEHHHAIVLLIQQRLYAAAFALLRVAFEAYVRGQWLLLCAKDSEVRRFGKGWEPPRIAQLIEALEKKPAFAEQVLSGLRRQHWKAMCAYTHTGGLQIQRWNTSDAIEPNYDPKEVDEVLFFAEWIASLSVIAFATMVSDDQLACSVLEEFKARTFEA